MHGSSANNGSGSIFFVCLKDIYSFKWMSQQCSVFRNRIDGFHSKYFMYTEFFLLRSIHARIGSIWGFAFGTIFIKTPLYIYLPFIDLYIIHTLCYGSITALSMWLLYQNHYERMIGWHEMNWNNLSINYISSLFI